MALATSTVEEYRRDPRFMQELEMRQREDLVGLSIYNNEFMPELNKGRQIKINREIKLDASATDAVTSITYSTLNTDGDQSFTVNSAFQIPIRIFDVDEIETVLDLHSQVSNTGMFTANQHLDKQAFSKLYTNGAFEQTAVDLTSYSTNAAKGNALYSAIMDANEHLNAGGFPVMDRKTVLFPAAERYLKEADKLTAATETAETRMTNGFVGKIDAVNLHNSINLNQATANYSLYAKGAIEVGSVGYSSVVVDDNGGGALTEPQIGDTFTNNSKTFTILNYKRVSATEYQLLLDRPIETEISDNAAITVAGKYKAYIPFVQGRPGQSVIQKAPGFEGLRDPDYHATLVRLLSVYEFFLSNEMSRKVVHIPVTYRSTTGGTWA